MTRWVLADAAAACCLLLLRQNKPASLPASHHCIGGHSLLETGPLKPAASIPSLSGDDTLDDGLLHSPDSEELRRPRVVETKSPVGLVRWTTVLFGTGPVRLRATPADRWPTIAVDRARRLVSESTVEGETSAPMVAVDSGCGRGDGCMKMTPWIHRQENSNTPRMVPFRPGDNNRTGTGLARVKSTACLLSHPSNHHHSSTDCGNKPDSAGSASAARET